VASHRIGAALAAIIVIASTLAGCARPVGDLGRAAPDPLHDQVMPLVGKARAALAKQPMSSFNLTDEEREMRDRIWRYLVSPSASDWFGDSRVELQRTGIAANKKPLRTDLYYGWLHRQTFASAPVRYAHMQADVTADIEMMIPTFVSICAVLNVDRQRGVAANGLNDIEETVRYDAAARQTENQSQIGWFVRALRNRYDSYNYALDHLLVETPHDEAVAANGLITELAVYVDTAERGDFCDSANSSGGGSRRLALPSRSLILGLPVKGS
jgi:hypothetical protein